MRVPPLLVFSQMFYVCQKAINQMRETPQGWQSFTRPLSHNMHFWDRMVRGVLSPAIKQLIWIWFVELLAQGLRKEKVSLRWNQRNLLLILHGEGKKNLGLVICFLLLLKGEIKIVWFLQPISSVWRPLAFLPVTSQKVSLREMIIISKISQYFWSTAGWSYILFKSYILK